MRQQRRSLLSFVFMCLTAMILAAGCGDSGSGTTYVPSGGGGSESGGKSKYATVVFNFPDLASAEAKLLRSVPEGTHFISFYGSNSKGDVLYGPVEYKAANKVNLPDVPVTTNIFFLQFRDSAHDILNLYATDKFTLKAGETTDVTVDNWESEENAPTGMTVAIDNSSIAAGYTAQCEASIKYGNGAVEAATELVDWTSSTVGVATVNNSDSKGLVKGVAPGTTQVTAEIAKLKKSVDVTVTDAVLETLEITTPDPYVLMYATYQFKAQAKFSDGSSKDVTKEVTWSSDNTEIAEIDETGLALAVKDGQANITATAKDGATDTTTFNISDVADVRSITISRIDSDGESIPLGFAASYKAVAKVSSAQREYDVTDQVKWNSENADTGAFVDATPGLYDTMGCAVGDTVISCVLEENGVESDNTLNLAVTDARVTGIKLYGVLDDGDVENPYILSNRENVQFIAKADLSDGSEPIVIEPSADLTWTVDPADAAIDVNGLVTPAEAGAQFKPQQYAVNATYNYTYEPTGETETFEAATTLNVADAVQVNEVTVEAIDPEGATEVPVGHTVKYKATAKISTMDLTFDVTDQVTWSDVSAVGTMNAGTFTAETVGGPVDVIATLTLNDIGGTEHAVDSEPVQITVNEAILESIAIDQNAPQIINNNNDFAFTATATYSDGSTVTLDPDNLPDGATMTWASADTSIAEIDESTGAVTPKADAFGQTEITVTYTEGDVTADDSTMLSTYDSMAVTEVTIDTVPAGVTSCHNGFSVQFQATAKIGTKDMEIDVTRQVEWNNDEIAAIGSIDENGVFTATATGNADIKATLTLADYGDVEQTVESEPITFTVDDALLQSITITSTDGTTEFGEDAPQILNTNENLVFTAIGHFSYGDDQELTDVSWESSVRTIAAIDPDTGAVTPDPTAWGQTKITVTTENADGEEITASTMLSTVDAMSVTELTLSVDNDQTTCAQGYTAQFRAIATIGTEGWTFDVTDMVTWDGIDAIGTIDDHGMFTGTTTGTSTITANYTATNLAGDEVSVDSNEVGFEVTAANLESITITAEDAEYPEAPQILNNSDGLALTATGHFSYGDDQVLTDVDWVSSNPDIADVDADGIVTPMADKFGQTKITATTQNAAGEDVVGEIVISTYDAMAVTAVELTVDNDQTTCALGLTAQFRAYATIGTEALTFDVTDMVTWDGIDAIGTIDDHGLFTGTALGTSDITATYSADDYSGTAVTVTSDPISFEVTNAEIESIEIRPANPMILNVDTQEFTATAIMSDGTEQELTSGVTWDSSDREVCDIDEDGVATPSHDEWGQVTITATYEGADPAETTLSIGDAMDINYLSIRAIDPEDAVSVAMGQKVRYQAIASVGTLGQEFDVTHLISPWTFDGDDIGSIDNKGIFEPTGVGTATIRATLSIATLAESVSVESQETLEITVTPAVLESITVTSNAADFADAPQILNNYNDLVLTAIGHYSDGSEQELTDVEWETMGSDEIATVDEDGKVTPVTTTFGQVQFNASDPEYPDVAPGKIIVSTYDAMAVTAVELTVDNDSIPVGLTAQFRARATIGTEPLNFDVTDQVEWSDVSSIGTIDEYGLFTATAVGGPVDVTATFGDIASDPVSFEVIDAVVDHIEIIPANPMILNVDTKEFTAKAILSDGTVLYLLGSSDLTWSSSDDTICTIDADGLATPVAGQWGQVTITATYEDPNTYDEFTDTTTLSIADAMAISRLEISFADTDEDEYEVSYDPWNSPVVNLKATAYVSTMDTPVDVTSSSAVYWFGDLDIVDGKILVDEFVPVGDHEISACCDWTDLSGATNTVYSDNQLILSVTENLPESLQVSNVAAHNGFTDDSAPSFRAYATYANGDVHDVTDMCDWETDNPEVGIVNGKISFYITDPLTERTDVSVVATYTTPDGEISESGILAVLPDTVYLDSLAVTVPSDTMTVGDTQDFTAIVTFSDGTDLDVSLSTTTTALAIGDVLRVIQLPPNRLVAMEAGSDDFSVTYKLSGALSIISGDGPTITVEE